jgi:hypothetical protein
MKLARRKFLHLAAGADTGLGARPVYPRLLTICRVASSAALGEHETSRPFRAYPGIGVASAHSCQRTCRRWHWRLPYS